MIKISVLISDVISRMAAIEYDSKKQGFFEKIIDNSLQSIFRLLMVVVMTFGLVVATIFCVIQYIMCIFEYYIVTTVGVIFIPFCLWDGTKSFTAKLVTLFSAYFLKIMVMVLCVFWVFSAFIDMGMNMLSSCNPITFITFANFLFTCLLGWVVTQNGPKPAVTLLNGAPGLSMGEFLQAAGTMAGAAVAAKKAGSAAAAKTGQLAQSGVKTALSARATGSGMKAAFDSARAGGASMKTAVGAGLGFGAKTLASGVKENIKEKMTGQKKADSGLKAGAGNTDAATVDRSLSYGTAKERGIERGTEYGEKKAKDAAKKGGEPGGKAESAKGAAKPNSAAAPKAGKDGKAGRDGKDAKPAPQPNFLDAPVDMSKNKIWHT